MSVGLLGQHGRRQRLPQRVGVSNLAMTPVTVRRVEMVIRNMELQHLTMRTSEPSRHLRRRRQRLVGGYVKARGQASLANLVSRLGARPVVQRSELRLVEVLTRRHVRKSSLREPKLTQPERSHFIRIELPPDATPEEVQGLEQAVIDLVLKHSEEYDYDIPVSGGAWYPPVDEPDTRPAVALSTFRAMLYTLRADNSPTDVVMFRDALQELADLGVSQIDLQIHLERWRAINEVVLRNMQVEENILVALDMVTGHVGNPQFRIGYKAGTS